MLVWGKCVCLFHCHFFSVGIQIALTACLTKPRLIDVQELIDGTLYARSLLSIDDPKNMEHDRVWIFTGQLDTIVDQV